MYIHEMILSVLAEHSVEWPVGDPKFKYVESQVLEYFGVHSEEKIKGSKKKHSVVRALVEYALEQLQEGNFYTSVLAKSVREAVHRMEDFIPRERLSANDANCLRRAASVPSGKTISQKVEELCSIAGVEWDKDHPKFVYVVSQVLEYFGVNTESDIEDEERKYGIICSVFSIAIEDDILCSTELPNEIAEAMVDREEVKKSVRPMYEFIVADDLTDGEREYQSAFLEELWRIQSPKE